MRNLAKRAPRISMWLLSVGLMLTLTRTGDRGSRQGVVYASDPCDVPINPVVAENCKTAADGVVGPAVWDVDITQRTLTPTVEGFATDISVNSGDAVRFKIDAPGLGLSAPVPYHLDIYRMGYYGGNGARRVATVNGLTAIEQPPCLSDNATGLVDCGNWVESASWNTGTAVSGIYFAKTVVEGPGAAAAVPSHIYFIVRDDLRPSDVLFQTSDTGWQAYNDYGGNSLYTGNSSVAPGRAVKVSYNRPFHTRALHAITFLFDSEDPMVRWLEANGYDVSYVTGLDLDRMGNGAAGSPPATILATGRHHAFLSVGHDEYWSGLQRAHVEAARDTGTNLAFFSGNEIFWRTRWENSVDPADTPHRTLVCYKETHGTGVKMDPSAESTGTWRDPRFGVTGGRPENALSGTIFMVNGGNPGSYATLDVSPAAGRLRFWRNTGVAAAALNGQPSALPMGTLGYEWDVDADNGFRPAGLIRLSSTTRQVGALLQDFGTNYGPGTANHALTLYRRGDALVFGAGTVRWTWGLDGQHDADPEAPAPFNPSVDMQQATVNLLTDMGMTPATPTRAFTLNDASVDRTAPTSTITAPQNQANVQAGTAVLISGTAVDGSSAIAGVEVSVDGGQSWHSASLTQTGAAYSWTYSWTPQTLGPAVIRSRASDDSANVETPLAGVNVAVDAHQCPCTIWSPTPAPDFIVGNDTGVVNGVELGVKFRADVDGSVSAVRFYKRIENTGSHVGHFWSSSDGTHWTLIASAAFDQESASGWQQASFAAPIPVNAGTTYLISYHNDNGYYAATSGYFTAAGHDAAPLHALQSGVDGPNGVFLYGALGDPATPITFSSFNGGNYWVDVVFDDTGTDTAPAAADESYAAIEDTAVNVAVPGVLANDTDADGNALQVTLVTGPAHAAEFTLNRAGSFTYTPGLDYSGSDSFTYKATDGLLHSNLATVTISVAAVNDAPVAASGSPTTDEEVPVAITLTATDTDTPLSSLTFAVAVPPQHGQLSGVAPALIYTPDHDFNGIDSLTFRAHDGFLDSAVATVTVTVRPVNDPPIATAGTLSAVEDTPATGTLAATDVDGDTLSYSVVTQGSKGSVTITGGATYTYTPQANLNGQDSFTFKANDGAVDSTTVTVTVNITPVNDPPAANPDEVTVDEDSTNNMIDALANDSSAPDPGETLTIVTVGIASHGTVTLVGPDTPGSRIRYAPQSLYHGPDSFTYTISDGSGGFATAVVSVTVRPVNHAPTVTVPANQNRAEGAVITVASGVAAGGADPDGDPLTFDAVNLPAGLTINPANGTITGTIDYAAAAGSPYLVTVTVKDGGNLSATGSFTWAVSNTNRAPVVTTPGPQVGTEGQPVTPLAIAAHDDDTGDTVTYGASGLPNGLAIHATTGVISGTVGFDASTTNSVVVTVTDNHGAATSTAAFSWTITLVNRPPQIDPIPAASVAEGHTLTIAPTGSDPDGQTLSFSATGLPSGATFAGGIFTWTPGYDQARPMPYTVTFHVSDGVATASQPVDITVTDTNRAPVLNSIGPKVIAEGQTLTITPSSHDADGQPVTLSVTDLPAGATFSGGTFTWTPSYSQAQAAPYNVTFTVTDGTTPVSETVAITVTNTNRAPVLTAIGPKTVAENATLSITPSATDADGDSLTYSATGLPTGATFTAGIFTWTPSYTQAQAVPYNVTFTVTDGTTPIGETVAITVTNINRAPVLTAIGPKTVAENATLSITPSATDADGDSLTYSATGLPAGATFNAGTFTWTPSYSQAQAVPYNVTFTVTDGTTPVSEAVAITVTNTNRAPVLTAIGPKTVAENATLSITPSATDADGDSLSYSATGLPTGATFSAGTFTWTPSYTQSQAAPYDVTFTVTDGATPVSEIVAITVTNTNRGPVLSAIGPKTVAENATLSITPSATDADGDALTYSATGLPTGATFSAGTFTWTPSYSQAQAAPHNVTFTVTDGTTPVSETVAITVTNTNRAPVLTAIGPKTVAENATLSITPSATDADGDALTYSATGLPTGATFSAGTFTWTPSYSQAQAAPHNVTFTVTDGTTPVSETVAITVTNTNRAPVLTAIGPKTVAENATLSITPSATDADGDLLTYGATGLPTGATFSAGIFTWTPSYIQAQAAPYSVTFTVNDGTAPVSETVAITVTNTNRAPVLTAIGPKTVAENATLSITPSATDADGDLLTISATGLPTGATFSAGTFTWTPSYSQAQAAPYNATFTVTDGTTPVSEIVAITVTNTNRPPTIATPANQSSAENDTIDLTLTASDPDGESLTYTPTGLPAGLSVNASGHVVGMIGYDAAAGSPYTVTITVKDASNSTATTAAFSWTIANTNRPPTITTPANQISAENDTIDLVLTASDPDGGPLTYTSTGSPAGLSVNTSGHVVGTIGYDAAAGSPYTVTITVKDASSATATTAAFTWTVANTNRPPAAIGDSYAVDEDQPLTVLQAAGVLADDTDADADTLTASIVTAPSSAQGTATLNGNGSFTFTPAADFNGTASFTYKADDGKGGTANATVTVTVRSINDLPTISDTSDKTTNSGTATPALPITLGDVETSAAALTMSGGSSNLALVPVANIVFSGSGASRFVTITPIAGQSGAATITLTVTDTDAGARSDTFVLSVNSSSQPTTTTLTSPTASPTTYGAAIVLNAAVTSATGTPTGSVEFFEGPRSLGTATLTAGSASLTTTGIGAGAPTTVTAVYTPTGAFATSNGTLQRTINKAAASAVLALSASPQAYSDLETFEATVTPQVAGQLGGTPVVTFKVGTQAFAPVALVQEGAVFKARLTVQLLEPAGGTGQMAPTTPTGRLVTATASGVQNYTVPNATKALVINKEDAQATYDGTTHAYTVGMNATDAAAVTLRATVKDITAADSVLDPNAGDISKATVFFYNRDTGVAISGAMPVTLVNSSDVSTGTATFNWAPTLGAANAQTFRIGVMVSSYYNRYAPADDALVTVSKPVASKFLTGDGQLTMATSSGLKAGTAGTKNDFGLGVTFTGTGAGPAGHFWTMMRSGANTYAVKSATLTSLVVSGTTATLSGTASIYDVTNGSVLVDGAATFTVTMTDGVPDQIGIVVRNGAGSVWFSSSAAAQQTLSSGTVTIRP